MATGLWAYEVLGWGGYWAWDPVETASLLPWLTLTAYFHLGPDAKRGKNKARELITLITFSLVFFATAIVRGGMLESVHGFGASAVGIMFLLFILGFMGYFFLQKRKSKDPIYTIEVNKLSVPSISLFAGRWSLFFLTLVGFWGVVFPIFAGILFDAPASTSIEYYNNWSYPFVLVFVAALIGCDTKKISIKTLIALIIGALGFGVVLALFKQPTQNLMANFGLPLLILALGAVGYELFRLLPKAKKAFHLLGRNILHLGIVVLLIGVFLSSTMIQSSGDVLAKPNSTIEELNIRIEFLDFTVYEGIGNVHLNQQCYPEYSSLKIDAIIWEGSNNHQISMWMKLYTSSGVVSTPTIIKTLSKDIYIHVRPTQSSYHSLIVALRGQISQPNDFIIEIRTISMVNLVWIGIILMCSGIILPMIKGITTLRTQKKKSEKPAS
jgi:cytochrome c biogenesis factor